MWSSICNNSSRGCCTYTRLQPKHIIRSNSGKILLRSKVRCSTKFVPTSIQRIMEGNVFNLATQGGGVPHLHPTILPTTGPMSFPRGTPVFVPISLPGFTPVSGPMFLPGGTLSLVLCPFLGGTPISSLMSLLGVPQSRMGGYPSLGWGGYPSPSQRGCPNPRWRPR